MAYSGKSVKVIDYNNEELQLDPMDHKSSNGEYGVGDSTNYGHVKLSDSTNSTSGVNDGVAATPKAIKDAVEGAGLSGLTANRALKSNADGHVTTIDSASGALYATNTSGNGATPQFGTLPVAQGGTGATSFNAGQIIVSSNTEPVSLTTRAIATSINSSTTGTNIPNVNAVRNAISSFTSVSVSGTTLVFS